MAATWDAKAYPYDVDYCDHFETPLQAYEDIAPVIDVLCNLRNQPTVKENRSQICVYDPYYCHGRAAELLSSLKFRKIAHEKRDFYDDIENERVPKHDILVTNPPFSDQHKRVGTCP